MSGKPLGRKDFFTSLIASYIVVIFTATFLMGYISTHNFMRSYTEEVNVSNQKVIDYINTLINKSVITVVDNIYADVMSAPNFRKFIDTHDYSEMDTISMYNSLRDHAAQNSELIYAIHLYSIKTEDIISSQYGFKTPGNTSVNRDFIELSKDLKGSRWIQTRSVKYSYLEEPEYILTKVFYINSPDGGAILAIDIRESDLYKVISQFIPKNCNNIIMASSQRLVLSHTNKSLLGTTLPEEFSDVFSAQAGHAEITYDNQKCIASFSEIANSDWRIIMITSASNFYPSLRKNLLYAVIIAIISILIAVLIAYLYSLRLSAPIRLLTNIFSKQGQIHELDTVVTNILEEFGKLNDTIEKNKVNTQRNFLICSYYKSFTSNEDMESRSIVMQHEFAHDLYVPIIINISSDLSNSDSIICAIMCKIESMHPIAALSSKISSEKIAVLLGLQTDIKAANMEQLLTDCLKEYDEYITFFYVGNTIFDLSKLSDSFSDILKLYDYGFFYPDNRFLYYSSLKTKIENPKADFDIEFSPDLLDEENYRQNITDYRTALLNSSLSAKDMHQELLKATHNLAHFLSRQDIKLESTNRFFADGAGVNINNFTDTMQRIFAEYLEKKNSLVNDKNFVIMQKMKKYIEDNYKNNVSLTAMSDEFGIHSTNLSRIFKTETGKNLSDYIKEFKLAKARELLLTTDMTVNEIASELDYNTVHYFIRLFKEKYGETPKAYRQINRK